MLLLVNILGVVGVIIGLTNYFLLVSNLHMRYSIHCLLGILSCSLIILSLFYSFNLPAFVAEAAYICINIAGLVKYYLTTNS